MVVALSAAVLAESGAPRAGVTISGFSAIVACTVVVTVSWDGGTSWHDVRGGTITGALGSTFVRDFVVPLNVLTTYRAVITGGSMTTVTGTVTVTSPYIWLQDPLSPAAAVQIQSDAQTINALYLAQPSFGSIARKQAADLVTVMGTSLPVGSVGVRQAPSAVPLSIQGLAQQQATLIAACRSLLNSAGQIVVRGLPSLVPIDPVAHVLAGDVSDQPATNGMLGIYNTFTMSLTQVQPTTVRIIIPYWTYDQVKALVASQVGVPTYANVLAAQPAGKTYTQWVANPGVAS